METLMHCSCCGCHKPTGDFIGVKGHPVKTCVKCRLDKQRKYRKPKTLYFEMDKQDDEDDILEISTASSTTQDQTELILNRLDALEREFKSIFKLIYDKL